MSLGVGLHAIQVAAAESAVWIARIMGSNVVRSECFIVCRDPEVVYEVTPDCLGPMLAAFMAALALSLRVSLVAKGSFVIIAVCASVACNVVRIGCVVAYTGHAGGGSNAFHAVHDVIFPVLTGCVCAGLLIKAVGRPPDSVTV